MKHFSVQCGFISLFLPFFDTKRKEWLKCIGALRLRTLPTRTVIKEILHFYNVFEMLDKVCAALVQQRKYPLAILQQIVSLEEANVFP